LEEGINRKMIDLARKAYNELEKREALDEAAKK
jgi:hypothetical protein